MFRICIPFKRIRIKIQFLDPDLDIILNTDPDDPGGHITWYLVMMRTKIHICNAWISPAKLVNVTFSITNVSSGKRNAKKIYGDRSKKTSSQLT
jgi:hypothetical protein